MGGRSDYWLTRSTTTKPVFTGPMNEKCVIKSVEVVSYGKDWTKTVVLLTQCRHQRLSIVTNGLTPLRGWKCCPETHLTLSLFCFLSTFPSASTPPSPSISTSPVSALTAPSAAIWSCLRLAILVDVCSPSPKPDCRLTASDMEINAALGS